MSVAHTAHVTCPRGCRSVVIVAQLVGEGLGYFCPTCGHAWTIEAPVREGSD